MVAFRVPDMIISPYSSASSRATADQEYVTLRYIHIKCNYVTLSFAYFVQIKRGNCSRTVPTRSHTIASFMIRGEPFPTLERRPVLGHCTEDISAAHSYATSSGSASYFEPFAARSTLGIVLNGHGGRHTAIIEFIYGTRQPTGHLERSRPNT